MKKRVLIVGLGSIGQRYLRLLGRRPKVEVFCLRSGAGSDPISPRELYSWREVERLKPWAALIANPTALHLRTALRCAALGAHLFIEKPLDVSLALFPALQKVLAERKLSAYVAYNLRFHPGLIDLKRKIAHRKVWNAQVHCSSWLPGWRPGKDYARTYSASRKLGGGVILDLSHEADYIHWLFGPIRSISGRAAKVSRLRASSEDSADMLFHLDGGRTIPAHLDFCSYNAERSVKVMTDGRFFHLDLAGGTLTERTEGGREKITRYTVDEETTYGRQLDYFLSRAGKGPMMNSPEEAAPLLAKLLEFRRRSS